jgi:outer membrane immunogenic protein
MGWLRTSVASGAPSAISGAPHGRHRDSSRRGRGPRAGLAALALILLAPAGAVAADMPEFLRGSFSPSSTRWDGFYVGGQAAYLSGGADFGNATQPLVAYILRNTFIENNFGVSNWTTLGRRDANSSGFGGFVGYNAQWDDVVLGFEVNYIKTNWQALASDSISRFNDSGGVRYAATIDASSSIKLIDYTSIRGRAGYTMGQFMPYGLVGFVVGRADIMKSATVTETETTLPLPGTLSGGLGPTTKSENQSGKFIYGYSAGLGLDMALTPNIFVRGEYEYVQFFGLGGLKYYLNTARAAVGLKF